MIRPDAREHAHLYRALMDGLGECGFNLAASRGRLVVGDLLEALDQLEAERSLRVALQARCDEQQEALGRVAFRVVNNPKAREEFAGFDFGPGPSVPLP